MELYRGSDPEVMLLLASDTRTLLQPSTEFRLEEPQPAHVLALFCHGFELKWWEIESRLISL